VLTCNKLKFGGNKMKRVFLILGIITLIIPLVLADCDMIGSYGMMGSGMYGMGLLGLIYLVIGAFIFSLIFWWVYRFIIKEKKK